MMCLELKDKGEWHGEVCEVERGRVQSSGPLEDSDAAQRSTSPFSSVSVLPGAGMFPEMKCSWLGYFVGSFSHSISQFHPYH